MKIKQMSKHHINQNFHTKIFNLPSPSLYEELKNQKVATKVEFY
jgi:hypothetical protein